MKYILGFLFVLVILLFNFRILIFNPEFYQKISENNPYFDKEKASNLINYFKSKEKLNSEDYTEKEIIHLEDVKSLINRFIFSFYFLIVFLLLLMLKYYKEIPKILIISSSLIIALSLVLIILNFSSSFYNFHLIFFSNDLWLLDPETTLIRLFPEIFFQSFLKEIFLRSFFVSLFLLFTRLIMRFKGVFRQ